MSFVHAERAVESLTTEREQSPLDLTLGPRLGRVVRVDPSRVTVAVTDRAQAARVTVSDLVALSLGRDFLVGLIETVLERPGVPDADEPPGPDLGDSSVALRIMPLGTLERRAREARASFRRGASAHPRLGESCFAIEGERLQSFLTLVGSDVVSREGLVLGGYVADPDSPVVADGNKLFQRHVSLLGSTGAGKTWAVAMMLERASRLPHPNLIVFDLHGEYWPLTLGGGENHERPIAAGLRIAGPADLGQDSGDILYLPYWLLQHNELMALILNPQDPYASDQLLSFTDHVQTLKHEYLARVGQEDAVATFTADSPIPYELDELVKRLFHDNVSSLPNPSPFRGRLTGLLSRIDACRRDPRYGFMFSPPESTLSYDWLVKTTVRLHAGGGVGAGIKVIDLSEVPSAVSPLVAGVLARLIYDVQFWMDPEGRPPVCLVCDEAHLYLPADKEPSAVHRVALDAFEAIAKEGRKYGVALFVVSQRPTDVSQTILSQCNNFIVMRLTTDHDQAMIERLVPQTLSGITGMLPALDVGEAVVIGDAVPLPTPIKFHPPTARPASATQPYWTMWSELAPSETKIAAGVAALRNRLRARD